MSESNESDIPSEHVEQREFVSWFRKTHPGVLIYAIPNGGHRHPATAMRLKLEGVTPGVPDLHIPAWDLWIEMKRQDGGTVGGDQRRVMDYLESLGKHCLVASGCADAQRQLADWLA